MMWNVFSSWRCTTRDGFCPLTEHSKVMAVTCFRCLERLTSVVHFITVDCHNTNMTVTGLPPLLLHPTCVIGGASSMPHLQKAHLSHVLALIVVFFSIKTDEGFDFIRLGKNKYRQAVYSGLYTCISLIHWWNLRMWQQTKPYPAVL